MRHRQALILLLAMASCARGDHGAQASTAADSMLAEGAALYAREEYDSARSAWTDALRRASTAHDSEAQAHLLTWLGKAAWRLGDLPQAQDRQEQALAIKMRLGMDEDLSDSYNALGLVVLSAGRNEEAGRLFESAIETARATGDLRGVGKASGNLALSYSYVGDPRARSAHRVMRDAGRTLGDARMEANALANEAMLDTWEGDPRTSLGRLDSARTLYRRVGYDTGEENALGQMAAAFSLTGEFDRAFAAMDTALALARRLELKEEVIHDLLQIAELHSRVGDYRRAVRYYDQAEALLSETGLEGDHAAMLRGTAEAHLRLGNVARARSAAEAALRLHATAGEFPGQLDDLLLLAELDFRAGGRRQAAPRLREAERLARRLDTRGARIAVALAEARLADIGQASTEVLATLRRAQGDMSPGDYGAEWEASALAARAYARLGLLDSAAAAGRRAVSAVERLRGSLSSDALRDAYVADRAQVYGDLVLVLLRLGRVEEAFVVADGARSRELIRQVSAARATITSSAVPRELLEGDVLLRRIDELARRLRESERTRPQERGQPSDTADAAVTAELAAARSQYEDLVVQAAQASPRATIILGARPARLDEVRVALDPDEALVEYLIASDRLLIFTVTRAGLNVVQADLDGAALTQRVRLLRELWGAPSSTWQDGLVAARALHATLIAPLQRSGAIRGATRLLIIPHGILRQVPFAALQDPQSGRFLVQDVGILQMPSAAALTVLRQRADSSRRWSGTATALAPFPVLLPATADEVAAVRASLPRTTILEGRQATEGSLRRALAGDGLVHVATHGILNAQSPMFSRLELAQGGSRPEDDGRLEVHELLGLSIRSPLVFLSGCETGAALEWTDDPVLGTADLTIAQAALSAGAANVVVTLWRIDDAGAARFATRFYRKLERRDAVTALAVAQRDMAADPQWASPYYWAGYVLSGKGRLPSQPQSSLPVSVSNRITAYPTDAVALRRSTP